MADLVGGVTKFTHLPLEFLGPCDLVTHGFDGAPLCVGGEGMELVDSVPGEGLKVNLSPSPRIESTGSISSPTHVIEEPYSSCGFYSKGRCVDLASPPSLCFQHYYDSKLGTGHSLKQWAKDTNIGNPLSLIDYTYYNSYHFPQTFPSSPIHPLAGCGLEGLGGLEVNNLPTTAKRRMGQRQRMKKKFARLREEAREILGEGLHSNPNLFPKGKDLGCYLATEDSSGLLSRHCFITSRFNYHSFGKEDLVLLDLFSGTGAVSVVGSKVGYKVVSLDNESHWSPTICCDIMSWDYQKWYSDHMANGGAPVGFIWASPPCHSFSAMRALPGRSCPSAQELAHSISLVI